MGRRNQSPKPRPPGRPPPAKRPSREPEPSGSSAWLPARICEEHRAGFVALCGRPNVGKSTLVNALLGSRVAVATPHPQTTRERLFGIWTREDFQLVLVDTPGLHRAKSALNRFMVNEAIRAAQGVDVVLFLDEAPVLSDETLETWRPGDVACESLESLTGLGRPIVLALTKCDRLASAAHVLPIIERWAKLHPFEAIVPVSAHRHTGLEALTRVLVERIPVGPALYPDEGSLTDRSMRWHAAQEIRAELFVHLRDELPYSCAVILDDYQEREARDSLRATIYVERESQRGIVIGRGAQVLRAISEASRHRIASLTGRPCDLRIEVKVAPDWTRDPAKLERLGYRREEGAS